MFKHNRQARLETFKALRQAAVTKSALSWAIGDDQRERRVTARTLPNDSVAFVREYLSQFQWPQRPDLSFGGKSHTAHRLGDHNVVEGVATVHAKVRTAIGVPVHFSVPVEIRDGKFLDPSIFLVSNGSDQDNGYIRIISQSSIDEMVRNNSAYGNMPGRKMLAPPSVDPRTDQPVHKERRTPGMFRFSSRQDTLRDIIRLGKARGAATVTDRIAQAAQNELGQVGDLLRDAALKIQAGDTGSAKQILSQAKQVLVESRAGTLGRLGEDPDTALRQSLVAAYYQLLDRVGGESAPTKPSGHPPIQMERRTNDPTRAPYTGPERRKNPRQAQAQDDGSEVAEQDDDIKFVAGAKVRVKRHLRAPTRGGPYYDIKRGATGTVIRDLAGDGKDIYIEMKDGCKCVIPAKFLGGAKKEAGRASSPLAE